MTEFSSFAEQKKKPNNYNYNNAQLFQQVRIWEISEGYTMKGARITTRLVEALKEHKGSVTCIKIRRNDSECVSASTDGTCIIWDLK